MKLKITVDFYRVEIRDGCEDFVSLLSRIESLSMERRTQDIFRQPIRLDTLKQWKHYHYGDITRLQMRELPKRAKRGGATMDLGLADDEGLADGTAFAYSPSTQVVAFQVAKGVVSPHRFEQYINGVLGLDDCVIFNPIFTQDSYNKLMKKHLIRKFNFRLATPTRGAWQADGPLGIESILNIKQMFEAQQIEVQVSVGPSKDRGATIARTKVLELASSLLKRSGEEVRIEKLRASAKTDENAPQEVIDLLNDRMREVVYPECESRTVPFRIRSVAVFQAWKQREQEINDMFG